MKTEKTNRSIQYQQRRDQIIVAAKYCFRHSGFHAASMAEIASQAQLSVGQVYRYFTNKDAIIEEMVRLIIDSRLDKVRPEWDSPKNIAHLLSWRTGFTEQGDSDHVLMLEVMAESTRNPRVANLLSEADERMFNEVCAKVKQHPDLSDESIQSRVEIMAVLNEGTALRSFSKQKASPEQLNTIYQKMLNVLFQIEK